MFLKKKKKNILQATFKISIKKYKKKKKLKVVLKYLFLLLFNYLLIPKFPS
jgi:hypothetical protein